MVAIATAKAAWARLTELPMNSERAFLAMREKEDGGRDMSYVT